MSPRFVAWIAERAAEDSIRAQMFVLALLVVALYAGISYWPSTVRAYGKTAVIISGVIVYVILFAFALFTIYLSMGLGR